jgi:hypothetical protein
MTTHHVCGEPIEDIVRALGRLEMCGELDGLVGFSLSLESDEAAPLRRALMRLEADLLREDADRIGQQDPAHERTEEQRRYDALMELVRRLRPAAPA